MAKGIEQQFTANLFAVFLRTPYNYNMNAAGDESALRCEDVTLAKQEFLEECDINTIVDRFGIGYEMPKGVVAPFYGDFDNVHSFHSAANAIAEANEAFDALPAAVRSTFANDPAAFVDFCGVEANFGKLAEWGLVLPEALQRRKDAAAAAEAARVDAAIAAKAVKAGTST